MSTELEFFMLVSIAVALVCGLVSGYLFHRYQKWSVPMPLINSLILGVVGAGIGGIVLIVITQLPALKPPLLLFLPASFLGSVTVLWIVGAIV